MDDCIFCKIAAGEIPSATLFEDEDFRVILDAAPATKGHALIVPKAHYADITDLPEELAGKAFVLAKRIITKMQEALPCDGYNVMQNNGAVGGQTVFHFHMHLIPRYVGDGIQIAGNHPPLTDADRDEVLQKAAQALS